MTRCVRWTAIWKGSGASQRRQAELGAGFVCGHDALGDVDLESLGAFGLGLSEGLDLRGVELGDEGGVSEHWEQALLKGLFEESELGDDAGLPEHAACGLDVGVGGSL